MAEHAVIAPSSLARTLQCPASVTLQKAARESRRYPPLDDGEAAEEGTAAHWVLERTLRGFPVAEGEVNPPARIVTAEMIAGAEMVTKHLANIVNRHPGAQYQIHVERRVHASRIHPTECWGTYDIGVVFPALRIFYGVDYKYGFGEVEVFENPQIVAYGIGQLEEMGVNGLEEQAWIMNFSIVQPRCYTAAGPIREWSCRATDLRALVNLLAGAAEDALSGTPTMRTGPQCENCEARHSCGGLRKVAMQKADYSGAAFEVHLPPDALGLELLHLDSAISLMEARRAALRAQVDGLLTAGTAVPFWRLERKPGALDWTVPADRVQLAGEFFGLSLMKPAQPITPTQAKAAGLPESMVDSMAARKPSTSKPVPAKDSDLLRLFPQNS